jgi:hypothetical protein
MQYALHTGPSSAILGSLLTFEPLVTAAVVEKQAAGQHHVNTGDDPFALMDFL